MGLVFWEIASKKLPYAEFSQQNMLRAKVSLILNICLLYESIIYIHIYKIMQGARPRMPEMCDDAFAYIIRRMWSGNVVQRPDAKSEYYNNAFHAYIMIYCDIFSG